MSPPTSLSFSDAGRLPAPGDNVAIAIRQLDAGTAINIDGHPHLLRQTILEGHRFAVRAIAAGDSYRVIPWPMAIVVKLLRLLPNPVFDRLFAGRQRKPRRPQAR